MSPPDDLLYELRFTSHDSLVAAFGEVQERELVSSCQLESHALRLQFVAPARVADALAERIYQGGGMRWCTAHPMRRESSLGSGSSP